MASADSLASKLLQERLGRQALVQALVVQGEPGLARRIEFVIRAVAGGGGALAGSDIARRRQRADQDALGLGDLGLGRGRDLLEPRFAAACFSSWRRSAESMPSFCAISLAISPRIMRLGTR